MPQNKTVVLLAVTTCQLRVATNVHYIAAIIREVWHLSYEENQDNVEDVEDVLEESWA